MVSLTNSTTVVQKATYVPLNIVQTGGYIGRAALKFGYIRQLNLQPGEVDAVRNILPGATSAARGQGLADANFWSILQQFEGTPLVSQLPSPSIFANFAEADLIAFGNGLTTVRKQAVLRLQQETAAPPAASPGGAAQTPTGSRALSVAQNYLNTSSVATNAFTANTSTSNMGMLKSGAARNDTRRGRARRLACHDSPCSEGAHRCRAAGMVSHQPRIHEYRNRFT